jgi:radical SAM protein with 4Fe4S-binding SPASM domain
MRVALIHVPKIVRVAGQLDSLFATVMPMGMFGLADRLDRAGHDVEMLHLGIEIDRDRTFDLPSALATRLPGLVGFSLHWHHQLPDVIRQAEAVRLALQDAAIVVGGQIATAFDRELLSHCQAIDAVLRGDAEVPIEQYAACLQSGAAPTEVPNLTWRRDGEILRNEASWIADEDYLSAIDFARFDLLRNADYYGGDPWMPMWNAPHRRPSRRVFHLPIGRGCNYNCAFCAGGRDGHRRFTGREEPDFRTAESVVATMETALDHGIDSFYACFDPAIARREEYWLDLFGRIQDASLKPAIEFECFSLPTPALVRGFARTFDLDRSKLVLSPGTASEPHRAHFHGPKYTNQELENALLTAKGCGVASHLCFSIYPSEGWEEARLLATWHRHLVDKFKSSSFVCPIEVEPNAPWERDPTKYGLSQVRMGFEKYLERHGKPGQQERAWEEEIGYAAQDLSARTLLLRSETEDRMAWSWWALSGLWRREWTRIVLGPVAALDSMLEVIGRWQPGQVALFLAGALDDAGKEAAASRIGELSHSVARVFFLSLESQAADGIWPTVPYAVERFRAQLPEGGVLTGKSLADRRDASLVARLILDGGRSLADELRLRNCLLVDTCKFGRQPCPAVAGRRLVFDPDGDVRGCAALKLGRKVGEGWAELVARLEADQKKIEKRRRCYRCEARDRCARCPAPDPFTEKEYCAFMQGDESFTDFADGTLDGPPEEH